MVRKTKSEKSESFDSIKEQVDSYGGVRTVQMRLLRDAHGAESLGPHVVAEIQKLLESKGIGWSPSELPTNADRNVRLFTLVSRFQKSLDRYSSKISPSNDEAIKKSFTCDGLYEETLEKIRSMLDAK